MEECFARVETKYLMPLGRLAELESGLRRQGFERMDFGSPMVRSLYWDTPDHALIRASLDRPAYKEKLRLRAYGEPGTADRSYVEIKKKYNGVVFKRRTELPLREAMDGLLSGRLPGEAGQIGREVLWMLRRWGLRPAAVIACNRDAWFCREDPGLRVTVDRDLSFRDWAFDLNDPSPGLPLLPADRRLVEIKASGAFPLWLVRLLNGSGAERTRFSKYGTAYRRYIHPETGRSEGLCSTVFLPRGA